MKRMLMFALALIAFSRAASAQDPVATALTGTATGGYVDPLKACVDLLKGGDFRVNSGKTYYKTAMGQNDPANRVRILKNAQSNLVDAFGAGQGKLATTWYWMARTSAALGDIPGADSSFSKAQQLAPGCKTDIDSNRQQVWYRLLTLAADRQKAGDVAGAMTFYRAANQIYRDSPQVYLIMGTLFAQQKANDSAEAYFDAGAKAVYTPSDTASVAMHNQALFNVGAMQLMSKEYPAAIGTFHSYLAQNPQDEDARKGLAQAFLGAGMKDSAQAILVDLGLAAKVDPVDSLFNLGVSQHKAGDYKAAAASFAQVVALQPFLREGLQNLANSQLRLKDGPGLLSTGKKLMALEPLNDQFVSLEVGGLQLTKDQAALGVLATEVAAWPIAVVMDQFTPGADSASLTGTATGREPRDAAGKAIKPASVVLVFEFVDRGGAVIATSEVTVPPLPTGQTSPIKVSGSGKAIASWRYRRK